MPEQPPTLEDKLGAAVHEFDQRIVDLLTGEGIELRPPSRPAKLAGHAAVAALFFCGIVIIVLAAWHDGVPSTARKLSFASGLSLIVAGVIGVGLATEWWREAQQRQQRRMEVLKWILARSLVEQISADPAVKVRAQLALLQHLTGVKALTIDERPSRKNPP